MAARLFVSLPTASKQSTAPTVQPSKPSTSSRPPATRNPATVVAKRNVVESMFGGALLVRPGYIDDHAQIWFTTASAPGATHRPTSEQRS